MQDHVDLQRTAGLVLALKTAKGRGVFAKTYIPRGTVIEVSPVLVIPDVENKSHRAHTVLLHYT